MAVVTIHKAKTNLSKLIQDVAEGKEVIIARGATPVARLVPVHIKKRKRRPGSMKGKFTVGPEFFEPLPQSELEGWE